ncbi:MAG: hypothetical protein P9L92_05060 [Candidatus Electryonea clarkiae]|nr:hypothetical protein [Candidatus Electryonea clarkiae]MDP8287191.1 hypothetical protein [Candidatus Electryonea clarkiae]
MNKVIVEGVPVIIEVSLIPLKAKAWLDLKERRESGEKIDK